MDLLPLSARESLGVSIPCGWVPDSLVIGLSELNGVLHKLVEFLRSRTDSANADCLYKKALDDVLALANLSPEERCRAKYSVESASWPDIAIILQRLAERYSKVFDVTVAGQPEDYLLWDGTSFVDTFSAEEPDAEYLCVGILALEGVITEIATANWDGLLEAAAIELEYQEFSIASA